MFMKKRKIIDMATFKDRVESVDQEPTAEAKSGSIGRVRWLVAIVVILIGIYALLASVSYLFNWKADCSLLNGEAIVRPDLPVKYGNICSGFGARIGNMLIGRSFGLVGVIIPVYLLIFGANLIRGSKRFILNRDTLTMFLVLILSSLTLGAIFGDSWNLFGSSMGGAFGLHIARMLTESIGIGLALLLLGAWAALGVFINSNFINVVNKAGSSALSSTDKLLSHLKIGKNRKAAQPCEVEQDVTIGSESIGESREESEVGLQEPQASQESQVLHEEHADIEVVKVEVDEQIEFIEKQSQPTVNDIYSSGYVANDTAEDSASLEVVEAEEDDPFTEVLGTIKVEQAGEDEQVAALTEGEDDDNPFVEVHVGGDSSAAFEQASAPVESAEEDESGAIVFVEVNKAKELSESEIDSELYDPTKDINNFVAPSPSLLEDYQIGVGVSDEEIFENKSNIEETLKHFGIPIQQHIKATVGPTITLYEIVQASGVKISKIQGLENDIAQNLKALGIRIIAPIPGKGTIGIELPNRRKQIVSMRSAILSPEFQEFKGQLPIVIGRTIQNENYVFDLAKMPHLLVAGATGQGKSVGLNAIITSLLYRKHPSELKFVMIDPKMVEFSPYKKLENHYMAKMESEEDVIITDPKKAVYTLNAICEEMESRLKLLSQAGVRNMVEYNDKFTKRRLNPDKGHFFMPYIVVIIDEFADLIMTAKEVEMPVMRIAQKARAVGIHLIVATQRPDVKVITGGIKANFPARIAFKVTQMIDSRTIIDQPGANQLIGRGDMLFSKDGELTRIQCALVETDEVARIVDHIGDQQGYSEAYRLPDYAPEGGSADFGSSEESGAVIKYDSLFSEIARAAVSNGGISTSAIQRNFEVGFNRAGRIMTQLERAGIVGRQEGSKPRDILFYDMPSLEAKLQELGIY